MEIALNEAEVLQDITDIREGTGQCPISFLLVLENKLWLKLYQPEARY